MVANRICGRGCAGMGGWHAPAGEDRTLSRLGGRPRDRGMRQRRELRLQAVCRGHGKQVWLAAKCEGWARDEWTSSQGKAASLALYSESKKRLVAWRLAETPTPTPTHEQGGAKRRLDWPCLCASTCGFAMFLPGTHGRWASCDRHAAPSLTQHWPVSCDGRHAVLLGPCCAPSAAARLLFALAPGDLSSALAARPPSPNAASAGGRLACVPSSDFGSPSTTASATSTMIIRRAAARGCKSRLSPGNHLQLTDAPGPRALAQHAARPRRRFLASQTPSQDAQLQAPSASIADNVAEQYHVYKHQCMPPATEWLERRLTACSKADGQVGGPRQPTLPAAHPSQPSSLARRCHP